MSKYIKIPVTKQMKKDRKKCEKMNNKGKDMDCLTCSLNGGEYCGCLADYIWNKEK